MIGSIKTYHRLSWQGNRPVVKRPTLVDLAEAAGVSIATVDRVLNRRLPVTSDTAHRVAKAAEDIGYHAAGLLKQRLVEAPKRRFGFLLQKRHDYFYHELGDRLALETTQSRVIEGKAITDYVDELAPQAIVDRLKKIAPRVDALAVVTVDHPLVHDAVQEIAQSGKPVFTLISDINAPARISNLAVDSRAKGRTAAWAISRLAHQPGKVGILVGTHGYLSQEIVEMSFRSYFREHAPHFQLLEPVIDLDHDALAYEAVQKLMSATPDLVGIYSLGGGQDGFVRALQEAGKGKSFIGVCNEFTPSTRSGLIDGSVAMALATPIAAIAIRTVELMAMATGAIGGSVPAQQLFQANIYISETI
jgi:LacI family transcriptional regulator